MRASIEFIEQLEMPGMNITELTILWYGIIYGYVLAFVEADGQDTV